MQNRIPAGPAGGFEHNFFVWSHTRHIRVLPGKLAAIHVILGFEDYVKTQTIGAGSPSSDLGNNAIISLASRYSRRNCGSWCNQIALVIFYEATERAYHRCDEILGSPVAGNKQAQNQ